LDLTPAERRLRAQLAANTRWSKPGSRTRHARKVREARLRYYEDLVDPDHTLAPAERQRCARAALRADMQRLALRSAKARRRTRKVQ